MNLQESIARYIAYIADERRLSPYTVRNYRGDLELFAQYAEDQGVSQLDELDSRLIRSWQMMRMEDHSARDTNRALCSLRGWCRYMRKMGEMTSDPFQKVGSAKMEKKLPVFFKEKEAERIYEEKTFLPTFEGERDKLLLRTLYETGIRRSEAIGLMESSIDAANRQIKVHGKRDKERIIPIENELLQNIFRFIALKRENNVEDPHLFTNSKGRPMSGNDVYKVVKQYMSGLSMADKVSPHVFRHTFASHMLNEGANIDAVKELLGHTDLMATEVYTHVTREHLKEAYRHAHPRAKQEKDR